MPGHGEGGKTHEGGGWVQRETHGVGKESGRGPQKKNKEITKSDPISPFPVMIRGIEERNIFMDDGDRQNLLPRVAELSTEKEVSVSNESGDGNSHGGDCPPFRGRGFSHCHDHPKRRGREIILMVLSNVPQDRT